MQVIWFLTRRLAGLAVVLFVASFIVFGLLYLAPGSPIVFLLGPRSASPEQIARVTEQYGLDQPFLIRFWDWFMNVCQGDLGRSLVYSENVSSLIASRLPNTLLLVGLASLMIALLGIGVGVLGARRSGFGRRFASWFETIGLSVPSFVVGALLISVLGVALGIFPVYGTGSGPLDRLWHAVLPAFALSFGSAAFLAQITQTALDDEQRSEHVQTAVARGFPRRQIFRRHVFRNALIPIVTVLGTTIATLIAGSVVIETVFAIDGIGSLFVRAIMQHDFAIVQGVVIFLVAAFVIINTIVDVLYAVIDPRISIGKSGGSR